MVSLLVHWMISYLFSATGDLAGGRLPAVRRSIKASPAKMSAMSNFRFEDWRHTADVD